MARSLSLRARFSIVFFMLFVALLSVFGAATEQRVADRLRDESGRGLQSSALAMVDRLGRDLWSRSGELAVLSHLQGVRAGNDIDHVQNLLDELRGRIPEFTWVGLTDPSGLVLAATGGTLVGVDIGHRPVFKNARDDRFVGDVHDAVMLAKLLPNPSGEPMKFVDISYPVRSLDGTFRGVLAAHLSWTWAREIAASIRPLLDQHAGAELYVIGADRTVLLGPDGTAGQTINLPGLDGHDGSSVAVWPDGRSYVTGIAHDRGYRDFPGFGWTVLVRQPVELAFAGATAARREIVVGGALAAALFALVGWLMVTRITRPLQAMATAADRLGRGEIAAMPLLHGSREIALLSSSIADLVGKLTEERSVRARMQDLAQRDPLTGLLNRNGLGLEAERAIAHARDSGGAVAVLYADLDGFKHVNDTLGHAAGDQVLREAAARLKESLRGTDHLARLGGDEFVMLLAVKPGVPAQDAARMIAERALAAVCVPGAIEGHPVQVGCTIGAAIWPADGAGFGEVLAAADAALYAAKRAGKRRVLFAGEPAARSAA